MNHRVWFIPVLSWILTTEVCSAKITEEKFCVSKPNGLYPDPDGCQSHIRCFRNTATLKPCRHGWLFDSEAKKCKKPLRSKGMLNCDVAIAGGGLSGLYMAYRLLKDTAETSVCVFEKDSRLGGRLNDFSFDEAPEISVGLGGWRVDTEQKLMLELVRELGLKTYDWTFRDPYLRESRGFFSDNEDELRKAYPALLKSEFGGMGRRELDAYVWNDTSQLHDYASLDSFVSDRITPEGAEYLSEMDGHKGIYSDFISPAGHYEWLEETAYFSGEYVRPIGGMSAIINALTTKLTELGASVYTCNEVRSIKKNSDAYHLYTNFNKVTAGKVVVAIPPLALQELLGAVAKQLQESPVFLSIQPMTAFKGGALFSSNTWSHLTAHQNFISNSDCLGQGFLHIGSGINDEDVMHTIYTDGLCSRKWRDVQTLGKDFLDKEVHRALEYKFNMTVTDPLETVYQYWEGAWHFQKGGTKYSMADVAAWAANPLQNENVFLTGEAYGTKRGWCEGVLDSCNDALERGWGIRQHKRDGLKKKITKNEVIDRLRRRVVPIPFP